MNRDCATFVIIILEIFQIICLQANDIPSSNINNATGRHYISSYPVPKLDNTKKSFCVVDNKLVECSIDDEKVNNKNLKTHLHNLNRMNSLLSEVPPVYRRILMTRSAGTMNPVQGRILPSNMMYPVQGASYYPPSFSSRPNLNMILNNVNRPFSLPPLVKQPSGGFTPSLNNINSIATHNLLLKPTVAEPTPPYQILSSFEKFSRSLDHFERKFYVITFNKLLSISPQERRTNGMSFVQSGFFLQLVLMALALEVDPQSKAEITKSTGFQGSDVETTNFIRNLISHLPKSSDKIKFRAASRLILWPGRNLTPTFCGGAAAALRLNIDSFNGTERPDQIVSVLNRNVEADSGGVIRDTFDEDDVSGGVTAVLTTTLYLRARWRSAPTVLNGTTPFRDADGAPHRNVRMVRLNDVMGYADIREWDAQAIEIPYASPDLSLVIVVPRAPSLRRLVDQVKSTSITDITARMKRIRMAAILPIYTLRMTLLLPNKLQAMGISRLFDVKDPSAGASLRLSHMVQRLMFWAEAGRNAFKDDGIEWDERPEMDLLVDRPYIFYVRWRNLTLMNGNFVL
ncbi:antichymotrypsin-2-like [Anticarsia gemmatalis]|uniref:antichymotrypsin-2-like n=1 Tax=Anticarsia gemmatalis TaxID=129554 RepID=UPI003F7692A9